MSTLSTPAPTINRSASVGVTLDRIRRSVPVGPDGVLRPDLLPLRAYLVACQYSPPSVERILDYVAIHDTCRGLVAYGLLARVDAPEAHRVFEASRPEVVCQTDDPPPRPWSGQASVQAAAWAAEAFELERRRQDLIEESRRARRIAEKLGNRERMLIRAASDSWEDPDRHADLINRAALTAARRARVFRVGYEANPFVACQGGGL
jgi:hypothetical protein